MHVRRIWAVGLLLLIAALFVLLHDREADDTAVPTAGDVPQDAPDATLLTSEAGDRERNAVGPGLETRERPEEAKPREDSGPVTVRVEGLAGEPLPGVLVGVLPMSKSLGYNGRTSAPPVGSVLETDAGGEAFIAHAPYDGTRAVLVYRQDPRAGDATWFLVHAHADRGARARPILGPTLTYRIAAGIPLVVRVVDAETGRAVRRAAGVAQDAVDSLTQGEISSPCTCLLLPVDTLTRVGLEVSHSAGWVAWEPRAWRVQISPYARRLVAHYPLRREVDITVSVLEPDRSPMTAAKLFGLRAAGQSCSADNTATDAYGRLSLLGIPFLPGEVVTVRAKRPRGRVSAKAAVVIPDDSRQTMHLEIVVPPEPKPGSMIGIGGGAGGKMFRGRGGRRTLGSGGRGSRKVPLGGVVVRVLRRNGTPAVAALVGLSRSGGAVKTFTDATGRARFSKVLPGEYSVSVRQIGLFLMDGSVVVKGSRTALLELREGRAGRREIHVVDERGRSLPYATLEIKTPSSHPWVDLKGSVQRLDPFTDHDGRRLLTGLEPGRSKIKVTWGSRSRTVTFGVPQDKDVDKPLRIVLRRPKAP